MDEQSLLEIPEDHVFVKTRPAEGSAEGFAVSGLLEVLPPLKRSQLAEILVVSGFTDGSDLSEVVVSSNVITRIWLFQAISEYIGKGEANGIV